MKNKILIVLLCCITTLGYAQEVDELLHATSAIEMLDGTTRASASNATSQATLRCVQVIKPEVSAILQQVCRMQDLIEIIIEDLGDVSISDELIISQLAAICSKIENININVSIGDVALTAVCDLDPVLIAISESDSLLCSKLELIESQLDNLSISACDVNLDPVLTAIDNSEQVLCSKLELIESQIDNTEQVLCSKLEIIDSKLDNLNISLSCDFDPVITAIDESEQILCSKLEIIDSKLDVLNLSHIEVVVGPITFTIGDLTITAICDFTSVLDAISESDALLCSKLEIIESILEVPSCATTPITAPTTITAEGSYCVADTINGAIEVNANNVSIDLNGHHITGSIIIDDGVEYPYIFGPGTIDGGSPAIYVAGSALGVKNLRLSDLTVRNGSVGIALENVFGGHISNVEMTQNNTGIELINSYNITIQDSVATSNSNAGYSLISSFTNCIRNSKAVGTGYGNNNSNDTIFGFVSQNGGCNIFENSIANGTQGANITDFNALVAGFALRGSESCSKIIGSESANATTSSNGVAIPYGILLEGSLGSALTLTAYPPVRVPGGEQVPTIEWSPDQKLLAVGTDSGPNALVIGLYSVDNTDKTVSLIATPDLVPTATVNSISWHPSGQFIAAGIDTEDAYKVRVYEYCSNNNSLKQVATPNIIPGGDVVSVDWSPNGKYLAIGGTDDVVRIYAFDAVEYRLTQLITESVTSFQKLEWHPSGRFLGVVMSSNFYVYGFNSGSSSLTVAATQSAPNQFLNMLSWTADGKFVALVDFVDSGEDQTYTIETFLFNGQSLTSGATSAGSSSVRDLDWSSDGRYLAAIVGSALQAYPFDRTGSTSFGSPVIQNMSVPNQSEIALNWSPDGQYIAVSLQCLPTMMGQSCTTIGIVLYEALSFPSKNVITNNTVYCNSGNMCPGGVGISGSSIANMIIGNTAYANPVPQQVNEPFVQTNYEFVTNIFNQLFGQAPSDVQNISIDACEPICAPTDLALIAKQIKYKVEVIESKIDNLSVSASASSPCAPTAITAPTTITAEGVYCVANTIAGEIEINGSDIVIDLNGYDIQGGIDILAGSDNVTILNGTVSGSSDAIRAEGATNITLENVTARNATVGGGEEGVGIHFINVVGGLIKNCEMTQNITGLEFNNTYKIVVDHSIATGNTYAGFSLVSSSTNCLRDCKAVDTGSNNTQVLNNGVFGFVSKDGHSNIFERCIANATQALSTTDSQSVVAGFALRGNEKCTKIIDSESANATTSPDGVTVPYGILLEAQLDGLVTVTNQPDAINSPRSVAWSPDQKYLAAAINGDDKIEVYEFDQHTQLLTKVAEQLNAGDQPQHVSWSPDSRYIACSFIGNGDKIAVYEFNRSSQSLTFIDQQEVLGNAVEVEWSYDGRYLAVAISTPIQKISIYEFNSVSESIRFVTNQQEVISNPQAISWSPDNKYTAAAVFSDNTINIYQFDITSETLILAYSQSFLPDFNAITVAWSPDGKYIAAGGNSAVRIYEFDRSLGTSGELLLIAQQTDNTFDVSWSPDGKYVAVVVFSDTIKVYEFDRSSGSLVLKSIQSGLAVPQEAVWSPDGQYIALVIGTGNEITIYSILSFPSKNVITNNTVYCNSGGSCPSGVGISGSSIQNLIIGNTAYSNPVPQGANHPIVGSNYYFVTNVFNQLFGQAPSDLQNISVDGCAPICTPTDVGLLAQQIKYKVCVPIPSQLDVIESKIDLLGSPCTPTAITAPTTITAEGVYCVANTIAGEIEINGSDIVVDLNGYDIQGGIDILTGSDNVTILNGTVSGSSDAIRAEGATNITLENVTARNATVGGGEEGVGIHFINVVGGLIKNCEMTQNITGLEFNNAYKIVVDHSVATGNTYAGFSLVSSSTNCLRDCKAVDTGSNNTQVLNNGVFGFVSKDGHSNIFERCIANATRALSTTDSQSVVAGFALRGDESCTKIIDSESANATTSPDGVTIPYGILLEAQFDALVTVTQETTTGAGEVVWSPDGKYVAVAEGTNNILIYEFDRESQVLIKLSATPTGAGAPRSIAWSADGNYLAVALLTGDMINVYEFDSFTGSLTKIANQPEVIDDPSSVAWSPNGQFLAAALRISDRVTIYEFNKVAGTLTKVSDQPDSIDRPVSVSWSPDGNYVAAAIANSGRFTVYGFDRFTKTLVSLPLASQSASTPQAVYWSPDGKYLAAPQVLLMRVYEFDRETESLNLFAEESTTQTPVAAAWSPDGQYLTAAISSSNKIGMYFFDTSSRDLILLDEETVTTPFKLAWSPDGQYTAVATLNANLVKVYNTLTFPSKNVITNNTVYCNSGGNCPSGVGISGSSIQNLIIGNTAYSNPVPQSANHPIVGSNYYFVTNVFSQLFGQAPSDLQNISVDGCAPICTPTDLGLLAQQIKYKVCQIDSQLDVIESKIDVLPFGATQIDIAISTQIDINASLQEVIDVIQSGDEILCSKLAVIEQKIDNITSSAMASPCAPTAITAPTTITAEGVYCVANTIAGEIEINGSDIVVDLNGYDIQGGIDILAGSDNITILNGTVSGASDAIRVEGATNITLENVKARNATAGGGEDGVGIHFINVLGGLIKNCEMTQNLTGLEFNNSHNITVDHSIATANSYAGFSLISSFTNCFRDCKSISTGAGNNQISGNIFGFVSRNGGCNIFENSIANGTQGLGITDCNALVAGFALRGSESCSKIINSESANTTTNPSGLTIPYGILLEDVFDVPNPNYPDPDFITGEFLITLTAVPVIPTPSADVQAVQWRPDQKYFAAGYDSAVSVYSFNSVTYIASKVADGAAAPTGTVTHLDWSPDGKYLAVGTTSGVFVYEFCTLNCTLKLVNSVSLANVSSVDWHPTAKYLAVATNDPDFAEVYVYTFDRVAQSLTQLFTPALNTTNPVNDVQWSPDGNYLAVVDSDNSANSDLFIYGFNKNNAQLALVSSVGLGTINVHAVAWRFDGKYIAVGGDQSLRVLEVSNGVIDVTPWGYLQEDTIYSLDWSSNGKYIVIGTDASATAMPDYMQVIQFDPCQEKGTPCDALVLIAVPNIPPTGTAYEAVNSIDWSPDGQFILAGTDDNNLRIAIYDALSFPMKNVIKNNTVYCNSGGSCPSGIGISGSSVANMIIGNTAYSNPVNPPMIGSNYVFVTNVFNQLFGNIPSDLQNISLNGCEPICEPEDLGLLIKQNRAIICSKLDIQQILLQSLVDNLL